MQVANLDNSRRLYELSGWIDTDYKWHILSESVKQGKGWHKFWSDKPFAGYENSELRNSSSMFGYDLLPAYSAGYLLRKLPGYAVLKHVDEEHAIDGDTFWKAIYQSSIEGKWIEAKGCDTPEDALALLAIKLFEEGVLK